MNPKLLFLAFALFLCSFRSVCQNFNTQDSLALVDLYNATNGPGWVNHTNWLTAAPARTWFGVISYDSVRVNFLALPFNNLTGVLPASIANFNASTGFDLAVNHLVGPLPSSLSNLSGVDMNLSQNQLKWSLAGL
ncbi:hypothetical protein ACQ86N_12450 [Puia sp. P3]|uniref:hypothetical protein n=1 Tax=Puia sp. P3 TaxID=3423952 RepID=UPI003D675CA3